MDRRNLLKNSFASDFITRAITGLPEWDDGSDFLQPPTKPGAPSKSITSNHEPPAEKRLAAGAFIACA